jgi:hypothetical protein
MSFDEYPDGDIHGECAEEINRLAAERDALNALIYTNTRREMVMDHRFFVAQDGAFIGDENFDFDAGLKVSGDFVDDEKRRYAQMIACTLNNAVKAMSERDALTAQNQELRKALKWIQEHCAGEAMPRWENTPRTGNSRGLILDQTNYALSLPDLSSSILAKRDAETLRKAAKLIEDISDPDDESKLGEACSEAFNSGVHRTMNERLASWNAELSKELRRMADELEKGE